MIKRKTILIYRTGQLGDTLIALPAIQAIRQKFPDHRLVLLTDQHDNHFVSSWDILSPTGWFDDVIFYRPRRGNGGQLQNGLRLLKALRALGPEYIFNLSPERSLFQQARDTFFFRYLSGTGNYIYRMHVADRLRPAGGRLPRVEPEWRQLLTIVDSDAVFPQFRLMIPEDSKKSANDLLSAEGIGKSQRLIAMVPGSKMPSKVWPQARFAGLGARILDQHRDVSLVVLGSNEDSALGHQLCSAWGPRSRNFAGKLDVYASAAVQELCIAYVGNDTGAMHLAGMAGVPCVAIFSARDYPGKWDPFGENHRILRKDIDCAGCMSVICSRENRCLAMISVEDVYGELKGLVPL